MHQSVLTRKNNLKNPVMA